MRIFVLITVCLLIEGCASSPVSPKKAAQVPDNRVYAFAQPSAKRTAAVQITSDGASAIYLGIVTFDVSVDGQRVTAIKGKETTRIWLTPGYHIAAVERNEGQFYAKPEGVTCLRVSTNYNKGVVIAPTATCPFDDTAQPQ